MTEAPALLTDDECRGLSRLTDNERAATAAHPRLADVAAAALAAYLVPARDGAMRLSRFIEDDLDVAVAARDHAEAARLKLALQHFLGAYGGASGRDDVARGRPGG